MRVLSGKLKGLKILTNDKKLKGSESFITRPTSDRVKETLFNILEYGFNIDFSQISFFDCFSGSGAIGIEAISRGSSIVTFLDKDGAACECITKNLAKFNLHENDRVNCVDVIKRDFFSKNLSYESNYKFLCIIGLVLFTFILYIFISIVTKAFKLSDIKIKH